MKTFSCLIALYAAEAVLGTLGCLVIMLLTLREKIMSGIAGTVQQRVRLGFGAIKIPVGLTFTDEGLDAFWSIVALSFGVLVLSIPVKRLYFNLPHYYDDFNMQAFRNMVLTAACSSGMSWYVYIRLWFQASQGSLFQKLSGTTGCQLETDQTKLLTKTIYYCYLPGIVIGWSILKWELRQVRQRIR